MHLIMLHSGIKNQKHGNDPPPHFPYLKSCNKDYEIYYFGNKCASQIFKMCKTQIIGNNFRKICSLSRMPLHVFVFIIKLKMVNIHV